MEIVMEGTSGLHSSVSHPVNDISVRENSKKFRKNFTNWTILHTFYTFLKSAKRKINPFRPPHPLSVELSTLFFLP